MTFQFHSDAPQAFAQVVLTAANPDAEIAFQAQLRSWHDERALPRTDVIGKLHAWYRRTVAYQGQRRGGGLSPCKEAGEAFDPLAGNGQIVLEDGARAGEAAFALLDSDAGDTVRELVGTDGDVVVLAPALGD